ncbi:MAG: Asp-tRNA(Asn)/Glu-tRNA(Gln) amidotransferase subunit GatA [Planctomycetota bacterium]
MPATARQLAESLAARELTSMDALQRSFDAIDAHEGDIGAFLSTTDRDLLRSQAEGIDQARARGDTLPRFAGVPIAVKDNIAVQGERLTCGSRMLEHYRSPFDATVVGRLKDHQLLLLGKTNMDEFGFGSSTENSAFHRTANPWNKNFVPGGTSGGSAAAVAAGYCPWTLGSDTGGSVRQPASFCGIAGLRPTYGRVSRYGLVAYCSSMDTVGPLANDCSDLLELLKIIQGVDPFDATSSFRSPSAPGASPTRLGVLEELFAPPCTPDVVHGREVIEKAASACGWRLSSFKLDYASEALAAYYIIASVEAASNLARYDGVRYGYRAAEGSSWHDLVTRSRSEAFGDEAQRRILLGTFAASAGYTDKYYETACRARRLIHNAYMRLLDTCDVLVAPISPSPAWRLGEKASDPMEMYLSDVLSVSVPLAGLPAVAIPSHLSAEGLPIGVQLIGKPHSDESLLELAALISKHVGFQNVPRHHAASNGL